MSNIVTQEELENLRKLKENLITIVTNVGELNLAQFLIENELLQLKERIELEQDKFKEHQQQERVLLDQLQQKYGTGNINLDTGEITV